MSWLKKFQSLIFKPTAVENNIQELSDNRLQLENEFLQRVEYKDVDFFHLNGYECWAKVVKIYDADTIHCVFFINGKAFKFKIRLSGIDTAEKKSKDPAEIVWANKATKRLESLIGYRLVFIRCHRWDKYGRLLADIYQDDTRTICLNQVLLEENLAYVYEGTKRKSFREWAPPEALIGFESTNIKQQQEIDRINDSEVLSDESLDSDFRVDQNVVNLEQVSLDE